MERHDELDALVDDLLESEGFLDEQDFLPDARDKIMKLHIAKSKCTLWYLEQLALMASSGVSTVTPSTITTSGDTLLQVDGNADSYESSTALSSDIMPSVSLIG